MYRIHVLELIVPRLTSTLEVVQYSCLNCNQINIEYSSARPAPRVQYSSEQLLRRLHGLPYALHNMYKSTGNILNIFIEYSYLIASYSAQRPQKLEYYLPVTRYNLPRVYVSYTMSIYLV